MYLLIMIWMRISMILFIIFDPIRHMNLQENHIEYIND